MYVMKDEDPEAMHTACEILLSLAFMNLSDEGRMKLAKDAAEALMYIDDYQPSEEMVWLGISTILATLETKLERSREHNAPPKTYIAASRLRNPITDERPIRRNSSS